MPSRWKYITAAWLRNCMRPCSSNTRVASGMPSRPSARKRRRLRAGQGAAQFADAMFERGAVAEGLRAGFVQHRRILALQTAQFVVHVAQRGILAAPAPHRVAERDAQQRRAGGEPQNGPATAAAAMPPARRPAARGTPAGRAWAKAATRPGRPAAPAARRTARSTRAAASDRRYRRARPAAHWPRSPPRHAARVMGHRRRIGVAQAGGPGADQHILAA